MSTISSFFSNKRTNINKDTEDEPPRKQPTKSGVGSSKTASLRTVTKWAEEFKIDLGYKLDSDSVVEMWCKTCRDFCRDRTSAVSVLGCF